MQVSRAKPENRLLRAGNSLVLSVGERLRTRTYADPGLTAIDDRQLIEDPDM